MSIKINTYEPQLLNEIRKLIEETKHHVTTSVNSKMSLLYWEIGKRINFELQINNYTSYYGKKIVSTLCKQLKAEFGESYSEKSIRRMMQFAKIYPERNKVVSMIRQLSWTHILAILPIRCSIKRDFYIQICIHEKWSVRVFRERIKSMLY